MQRLRIPADVTNINAVDILSALSAIDLALCTDVHDEEATSAHTVFGVTRLRKDDSGVQDMCHARASDRSLHSPMKTESARQDAVSVRRSKERTIAPFQEL